MLGEQLDSYRVASWFGGLESALQYDRVTFRFLCLSFHRVGLRFTSLVNRI